MNASFLFGLVSCGDAGLGSKFFVWSCCPIVLTMTHCVFSFSLVISRRDGGCGLLTRSVWFGVSLILAMRYCFEF